MSLDEVAELPQLDLRQKAGVVASLFRFVVIDDSSRAGQQAEIVEIENRRVVTVVLRLRGTRSTYVTRPLGATSRVIREIEYEAPTLSKIMTGAVAWAEETIVTLVDELFSVYPWRSPLSQGVEGRPQKRMPRWFK